MRLNSGSKARSIQLVVRPETEPMATVSGDRVASWVARKHSGEPDELSTSRETPATAHTKTTVAKIV